jgi:hypothetical protein
MAACSIHFWFTMGSNSTSGPIACDERKELRGVLAMVFELWR